MDARLVPDDAVTLFGILVACCAFGGNRAKCCGFRERGMFLVAPHTYHLSYEIGSLANFNLTVLRHVLGAPLTKNSGAAMCYNLPIQTAMCLMA